VSQRRHKPPRLYVTDCEGPISCNDNAQELAARFIPDGAAFFARLSRYDDFLADVVRRSGYNAGDTLRLLAPFLVAHGASDEAVEQYSAANVALVPGADALLRRLPQLLPAYIISTSYTPYVRALCHVTGFPFEQTRCTALSLDAWKLPPHEVELLREWTARIVGRPIIRIPAKATSIADLSEQDAQTVSELDSLFWSRLEGTVSAELIRSVRPIGGRMKLAALEEIVAATRCARADVMYVGDSITDAPALAAVRTWGGVAVSFNGNGYALAAAEFAVAAADTSPMLALARAFAAGGSEGVRTAARAWPPSAGGLVGILDEDREVLTAASLAARSSVRGEPVAQLG
jgi:predicted HAD superfamily phosphohydrolase